MASSAEQYCSVCENSSVRAVEWCTDCDEFLCSNCLKHHKASKLFKHHTTITTQHYEELPECVKKLSNECTEHDEQLDSFCTAHGSLCCIRCLLTTHKEFSTLLPIKDLTSGVKTSPSLLDLEQNIKDFSTYIEKLKLDKEQNIEEIQKQKAQICDEIAHMRKAINDHLDKLESNLIERLNDSVTTSTSEMKDMILDLNGIRQRVLDISTDLVKIKEHASDFQTFLTVSHLTSALLNEEMGIFKLKNDGKLNGKKLSVISGLEHLITQITSFADVTAEVVERNIKYKKEKEKQAQITGAVKQIYISNISFKLFSEFNTKKGLAVAPFSFVQVVSGCCAAKCKQLFFTEYNSCMSIDHLVLTTLSEA